MKTGLQTIVALTNAQISMNEQQIQAVSEVVFNKKPLSIERKTIGICNEVYELSFDTESVILRMNLEKEILYGTHKHLPLFKKLGIKTPDFVAEDYTKSRFPFCYHILTKIEGKDLGLVIDTLSETDLKQIAADISEIFDKFNSLSHREDIEGILDLSQEKKGANWEKVVMQRETILARNAQSNVIDQEILGIYHELLGRFQEYFVQVASKWFYDDLCYKNVMIHEGKFTGLVDLDFLSKGDYLSAIGTIMSSYYGEKYGKVYLDEIVKLQQLTAFQQQVIRVYAILNLVLWTSEEGITFNSNSSGSVNWENVQRNKQRIIAIYHEMNR